MLFSLGFLGYLFLYSKTEEANVSATHYLDRLETEFRKIKAH